MQVPTKDRPWVKNLTWEGPISQLHLPRQSVIDKQNVTIERALRSSFSQLGYQQLAQICPSVRGDTCTLTGQLDTFYLSQTAQTAAAKVEGISRVVNKIDVVDH